MAKSPVREYAILYIGGKRIGSGATANGGNVLLNAGVHALGGPEHTGQLPAARVDITDAGDYYVSTEVEGALQEIGAELDVLAANVPLQPVMATSPNLVTTDGTAVWVPLVLADGSPVMVEA
jgi:hypothetical protein